MNTQITSLRARSLGQLTDLEEFMAFTVLAYQYGREQASELPATHKLTIPYEQFGQFGLKTRTFNPTELDALFKKCHEEFLVSLVFQQQLAVFEHFFTDALRLIFCAQPRHLPAAKKIDYSAVLSAQTKEEIVDELIDREINDLKYQPLERWFAYLGELVKKCRVNPEVVSKLTEMKATRDLLVHNRGVINQIYLRKAGPLARGKVGDLIGLPYGYRTDCWRVVAGIIVTLTDQLSESTLFQETR